MYSSGDDVSFDLARIKNESPARSHHLFYRGYPGGEVLCTGYSHRKYFLKKTCPALTQCLPGLTIAGRIYIAPGTDPGEGENMKEVIIETAVRMDMNADTIARAQADADPASIDSTPAGIYLHNQTAALGDAWLPAVAVCDSYGIDLETLRMFLKAKGIEEPGTRDLPQFREYTPISARQIKAVQKAWSLKK